MKEKSPVKMQNVVGSFPHSWSCVVDCLCRAVNQVDDDHDHGDEDDHHADDDGDKNKTGHLYISTERSQCNCLSRDERPMKEAASVPPFLMTSMIIMILVEVMVMVMKVWIKLKGLSIQCYGDANMMPTQ